MQADEWVKLSTPWLAQARAAGMAAAEGAVVVDAAEAEPFALSDDEQAAAVVETAADIEARPAFYEALYPLLAERETSLSDAAEKLPYMFWGKNVVLDAKSVKKVLQKEGARADEALRACREVLANAEAWECRPHAGSMPCAVRAYGHQTQAHVPAAARCRVRQHGDARRCSRASSC